MFSVKTVGLVKIQSRIALAIVVTSLGILLLQSLPWAVTNGRAQTRVRPAVSCPSDCHEYATADDTYYVGPDGSDTNDGLSPGTAFATLNKASSACGSFPSTCVVRVSRGGVSLASSVTFSATTLLECDARPLITFSSNSLQIIFNGQGSAVTGCGFQGQGAEAGVPPIVSTQSYFVFNQNSVSNFGSTGGKGELSITSGDTVQISNNIFGTNGDYDIAVLNVASQTMYTILITSNVVGDLLVKNTNGSLAAVNINSNSFAAGETNKTNPCVSVSSSGVNMADVTITGNVCVVSTANATVGYSITDVSALSMVGNIYDASGISQTSHAVGLNEVNGATVSGNTLANFYNSESIGTGIEITGQSVNLDIGPNTIEYAATGISIASPAAGTTIETQKFGSVTTSFSDSGSGTDIRNRSYSGEVTLSGGSGTFTIPSGGAFSSTTTFFCNSNDITSVGAGSKAIPATTISATVSGTGTHVIVVTCTGH
jgi:hypothetical protein